MDEDTFAITDYNFNASRPPTIIQLYGGPICESIVSVDVLKNDDPFGGTSGLLPKNNRLASIVASQARFQELCDAINGGGNCSLVIASEMVAGRRRVQDIWVEHSVLHKISMNVSRTATTTHDIYEVLSTRLGQLLGEVSRTNRILSERLTTRESTMPGSIGDGSSTNPPPRDDDCEDESRRLT